MDRTDLLPLAPRMHAASTWARMSHTDLSLTPPFPARMHAA